MKGNEDPSPQAHPEALRRLRRIEGQLRGLQGMVEEGRGCEEVLAQMSSVHQALRSTGRVLLLAELRGGVDRALGSDDRGGALEAAEAALELGFRHGGW